MQIYCSFVDSNFVFSAVFLRMFEITDFFSLLKGAVDEVFQYCILVLSVFDIEVWFSILRCKWVKQGT